MIAFGFGWLSFDLNEWCFCEEVEKKRKRKTQGIACCSAGLVFYFLYICNAELHLPTP